MLDHLPGWQCDSHWTHSSHYSFPGPVVLISFLFLCPYWSLFQSSLDQSDSMGKGCGADWAQKRQGSPHLLHILQVDNILGIVVAILGLVAMVVVVVVVVVDFVTANGAHRFAGLLSLDKVKCPMTNFLCFLLPFDLSLDLLVERFFFINWMGFGQNGQFSSFYPSSYA